jgi:mRNA-degrading endonuclease RelE of RelBE toxin-antitoxin system
VITVTHRHAISALTCGQAPVVTARRGTYRIVYRIDENSRIVHVLDIDRRF